MYTAGASGAVLFCLHGCGYTGLTWAAVAAAVKDRCHNPAVLISAHRVQCARPMAVASANHDSLIHHCVTQPIAIAEAALLRAICDNDIASAFRFRVVAFDMRGHGETTSSDDLDLSSNTLAAVGIAIALHGAIANLLFIGLLAHYQVLSAAIALGSEQAGKP